MIKVETAGANVAAEMERPIEHLDNPRQAFQSRTPSLTRSKPAQIGGSPGELRRAYTFLSYWPPVVARGGKGDGGQT